ncbi:reverse transcriptase, RNaseH [Purpureocillium lilacinum]|uniref:Reverse transcriptase, RNaseH n=1 Tax=Purpureocillium lilacinum TaxID=33203 RepID=A0A179F856_PURLI|nr:reverse transcriptase, RNaseH [Purpureocillium lilacinum]
MASASSSPPRDDDRFNLGPRTPSGLAREARAALLRHSPATREGEIGVSRSALWTAYTPSSPLHAVSYAAATEGAQCAVHFDSSEPDPQSGDGPVSIANAAHKLVVAQNEVYSAKLAVFRAFCSSFDDTAKQFTSGPALQFAQKFSSSFLQYWTDVLAGTHTNLPTTKPSYATVVGAGRPAPAAAGTTSNPVTAAPQNQWQQQPAPRRQGQRNPLPPPIDDLRVFARLRPGQTADMSGSFAVRTHIADKLGIDRSRIPQAHPCKTGWAIRAADLATRDLLTERQTEWASDISAEIVETRQEWYKYAVQGCPRRLNNIFGEAIDNEKAIRDEVATQTGQTPVMVITAKEDSDQSPTRTLIICFAKEVKHYWRLFDTTSYARRITKTRPPKQCDNCWDYHSRYSCGRQPRCKDCGRIGHALDTCTATQQCANCRGPHAVDFSLCPARPKKINGVVRSLNRPEKDRVCRMGLRLFQQHTAKPASSPPREVSASPESQSATASDTTSTSSRSTPTSSDAITPEPERENSAPRPSETTSASTAAPATPNSQASPTPSIESASSVRHSTEASASPTKPSPAIPTTSTDSATSRASSAHSERSNSPPVRQSIEMSEQPNEYVGNGLAPPASPSPSARSSLSPVSSVSTPTPSLSSTCLLGTPAPEVRTSSPQPVSMNRRPRRQHRDKRQFRVFQANVGKNGPSHDCALALAGAERYEVILLQEPWTQVRDSRCLTKTHPAYDTYSPVSTWEDNDTRPRVMTYIRRGARLLADQQRPAHSRDILWLAVNGVTVVNIYREPQVDTALEILFAWSIPSQCIIAGDFNARHHTWQLGRSHGHGNSIASWASENDLSLLNPIDTPTNAHGNTIDLAFSNIALAQATVEDHLATSSDHFTLSISLPALTPAKLPKGKILLATDDELKRYIENVEAGIATIPAAASTPGDLDLLANAIIDLMQTAARAAGRQSQRRSTGAPWWNEECIAAVAELRCVRRAFPLGFNYEVQTARRELRAVVRRAKRTYWRNLINGVQEGKDIFKVTRWLKSPGVFRPPPLQVGETIVGTQTDKAEALRQATLERRTAADDISDPWIPVDVTTHIPIQADVPIEEVQDSLLRTGNTSPGADNTTVRLLQTAWPAIGKHVQRLYQGCLTIGYHPRRFKEAEVVMIEKPGKRDLSKPRAWRPISLLSCLGKGLERLIARRLPGPRSIMASCSPNRLVRSQNDQQ